MVCCVNTSCVANLNQLGHDVRSPDTASLHKVEAELSEKQEKGDARGEDYKMEVSHRTQRNARTVSGQWSKLFACIVQYATTHTTADTCGTRST
jgi:hypothetical protein